MASARILRREARVARKALDAAERASRTTLADVKKLVRGYVTADPCTRPELKTKLDTALTHAEPGIGPAYLTTIREAVDKATAVPCKIKRSR